MGGKVFEGSERVTTQDRAAVEPILNGFFGESNWVFIGSSFHGWPNDRTYGDLDVAVVDSGDAIAEMSADFSAKKIGKTTFFAVPIEDKIVQVDVTPLPLNLFRLWVQKATVVPLDDPYKAAVRNELFFAATKHLYPGKIIKYRGSNVEEFTRARFTIHEGVIESTYSYSSPKTGKLNKNPVKVSDSRLVSNFDSFIEKFGIKSSTNFQSFYDVSRALMKLNFSSTVLDSIIQESKTALARKGFGTPFAFDMLELEVNKRKELEHNGF